MTTAEDADTQEAVQDHQETEETEEAATEASKAVLAHQQPAERAERTERAERAQDKETSPQQHTDPDRVSLQTGTEDTETPVFAMRFTAIRTQTYTSRKTLK